MQTDASYVELGISLFSAIPSIIITLFIGGWSDKVGRRPALIAPTLGSALEALVVLFVMYFQLPIYCLFIGGFLHGICGYYTTMILACMAYVADTTEESKIALRLGELSTYSCCIVTGTFQKFSDPCHVTAVHHVNIDHFLGV